MPKIADYIIIDGVANNQKALLYLDCGATSRFINSSFVYTYKQNFTLILLERARQLGLADRENASSDITYITKVNLNIASYLEQFYAFVTKLDDGYDIILDRGQFNQHQLSIEQAKGRVVLDSTACSNNCKHTLIECFPATVYTRSYVEEATVYDKDTLDIAKISPTML